MKFNLNLTNELLSKLLLNLKLKTMKKLLAIIFALTTMGGTFAINVNLQAQPTQADINNPIKLILKISANSDENGNISVEEIKWLDNFQIVGQNQFQSSSSQITIINWKTKSVTNINYTLVFDLVAKKHELTTYDLQLSK